MAKCLLKCLLETFLTPRAHWPRCLSGQTLRAAMQDRYCDFGL